MSDLSVHGENIYLALGDPDCFDLAQVTTLLALFSVKTIPHYKMLPYGLLRHHPTHQDPKKTKETPRKRTRKRNR